MSKFITATKVVTGKVRMNYVNVFTARTIEGSSDERYSICILIPKNDRETLKKINDSITKAIAISDLDFSDGDFKLPLRDGDLDKNSNLEFKNHYFINATSKFKPGIVDLNLNEITDPNEVYSGCYGRVSISFYDFNAKGHKGIGCCLLNIQKLCDGERLGFKNNAAEDFSGEFKEEGFDILN